MDVSFGSTGPRAPLRPKLYITKIRKLEHQDGGSFSNMEGFLSVRLLTRSLYYSDPDQNREVCHNDRRRVDTEEGPRRGPSVRHGPSP